MPPLSRSQVDRLGERLGDSEFPDPADLELLDEYERSFEPAQTAVTTAIREQLGLNPTARTKTVHSIVAKVRRERTALSRMQDVAGCRLVVRDLAEQDRDLAEQDEVVERLCGLPWDRHRVFDRRATPSHGYRAVHVIVTTIDRHVEVQVRTVLQDLWAQVSERMADRYGLDVKYGGGPTTERELLVVLSSVIQTTEDVRKLLPDVAEFRDMESQLQRMLGEMLAALSK